MNKSFDRKLAQCAAYILAEGTEWSDGMRSLFLAAMNEYLADEVREKVLELIRGEILEAIRDWWYEDAGYELADIREMREYGWKQAEKEAERGMASWHRSLNQIYFDTMMDRVEESLW